MQLEICKQIIKDDKIFNCPVAWCDVRTHAEMIVNSLNLTQEENYVILYEGKEISINDLYKIK